MSAPHRLMLFMLSALSTVVIPAVMVSFYHSIVAMMSPPGQWIILAFGLVPLTVVMIMCFIGLFYSIFRVKTHA